MIKIKNLLVLQKGKYFNAIIKNNISKAGIYIKYSLKLCIFMS